MGAGKTLLCRGLPRRWRAHRSHSRGPVSVNPIGMSIAKTTGCGCDSKSPRASSTTSKRTTPVSVSRRARNQPRLHPSAPAIQGTLRSQSRIGLVSPRPITSLPRCRHWEAPHRLISPPMRNNKPVGKPAPIRPSPYAPGCLPSHDSRPKRTSTRGSNYEGMVRAPEMRRDWSQSPPASEPAHPLRAPRAAPTCDVAHGPSARPRRSSGVTLEGGPACVSRSSSESAWP